MARLKAIKPRLGTLKPRIGPASGDERGRLRERDKAQPWRSWYYTARWQKLRREIWARDNYTCQKTGVLLIGKYPADNSPVADHIEQHRGDERLFWDPENLQTVSKAYHDSVKQAQERRASR